LKGRAKKLGPSLVRGPHGRIADDPAQRPLLYTSEPNLVRGDSVAATAVKAPILDPIFGE